MPKVSVIVPVHNPGQYFKPLLNSLIHQTLTDIEILLIDDGSIDGSKDVILEYANLDDRVKYIFREQSPNENFGQKYSLDLGRAVASGEYIMIIDHDDELMLDALEILYSYTDHGKVEVVQGRNISINENNELVYYVPNLWQYPKRFEINKTINTNELINHLLWCPTTLWCCLIKNDFQKNIELIDACFNDFNFVWKMKLLANTWIYISRYVYINNNYPTSTTSKYGSLEIIKNLFDLEKFLKEHEVNRIIWYIYSLQMFSKVSTYLNHPYNNKEEYIIFITEAAKAIQRNIDISNQFEISEELELYQKLQNYKWDKDQIEILEEEEVI